MPEPDPYSTTAIARAAQLAWAEWERAGADSTAETPQWQRVRRLSLLLATAIRADELDAQRAQGARRAE